MGAAAEVVDWLLLVERGTGEKNKVFDDREGQI